MIKLILVVHDPSILRGLRLRLDAEPDVDIIAEASDSSTALMTASALCPDVVILDGDEPVTGGFATAEALHAAAPQAVMIVLTHHDDAQARARAGSLGITCVPKRGSAEGLLVAIRGTPGRPLGGNPEGPAFRRNKGRFR